MTRTDLGQWLCQSSFCLWGRRGGPVCRLCVAAGSCPWHERGARATGAPSSVTTFGRASLPLLAFGHFPLTGGIGLPPWRGKAFGRPQGSPLRISKNGGRVWDPPLQKTKPFRVCRRGRILAGPSGNGRRLGRAARCAAPTAIQHRCRWFGKPRRRHGTAPAEIFANSGPRGPAGI